MVKETNEYTIEGGAQEISYSRYSQGEWHETAAVVPSELPLTIYVNGQELVTILCTPLKLNCLVIGFLYAEGIISTISELSILRVCEEDSLAEVRLNRSDYKLPERRVLTSGCGGGTGFATESGKLPPLDSDLVISPQRVFSLMKQLYSKAELYHLCGGVHASALSDPDNLLVVAEDIGRHNTLDKIGGECLLRQIPTEGRLLVTTGRISSEMLVKAAKMRAPIIISRTSPTGRAISLACDLGITLVGYTRGRELTVYSHRQRVQAQP